MTSPGEVRETFSTRFGVLMTMIGVAVGLGNVWRFPYLAGKFGGAAFVAVYVGWVAAIGVPALMAEWALGRSTRRGTVGAFARGGLPGGRIIGWILFGVVVAATAYYTNVVGWVLVYGFGTAAQALGIPANPSAILPPDTGFVPRSFFLQLGATSVVLAGCALVLVRGLRGGIERASRVLIPLLFGTLLLLVVRTVTLEGTGPGIAWYFRFDPAGITPQVVIAALGQAVFSLSLGGTFMVAYGSYLETGTPLGFTARATAFGDTLAGLLAGLAILPAAMAYGLEVTSGPGLLFATLPQLFAAIPGGGLLGPLFFLALFGAAWLSAIAAFEVLVAGLTDNTSLTRRHAVWLLAGIILLAAIPPMINLAIFVPWDLTFGSGMQTLGALLVAVTVGWCLSRERALEALGGGAHHRFLRLWIRWVIPGALVTVGVWWVLQDLLGKFEV